DRDLVHRLYETVGAFGLYGETLAEVERVARVDLEGDGYARSIVACERDASAVPPAPAPAPAPAAALALPAAAAPATSVHIACEVDLGRRYRLTKVELEGNQEVADARLREVI